MKSKIFSLVLLGLTICGSAVSKYMGKNANGLPVYQIDLDQPAELRFADVATDFRAEVKVVLD